MNSNKSRRGFTLAELLIVVAIIAVLVAVSIPVFSSQLEKTRVAVDAANERAAKAAAVARYFEMGSFSEEKILTYDVNTGILINMEIPPYGKAKDHKNKYITATIAPDGKIKLNWDFQKGATIFDAFDGLKGEMTFLVGTNGKVNGNKEINSEGQNETNNNSWAMQINAILKTQFGLNDEDALGFSYVIKAKNGADLNNLKSGDLVIYYGEPIALDDIGEKSVTLTSYDIATKKVGTATADVVSKTTSGKSYPVYQIK